MSKKSGVELIHFWDCFTGHSRDPPPPRPDSPRRNAPTQYKTRQFGRHDENRANVAAQTTDSFVHQLPATVTYSLPMRTTNTTKKQ